MYICSVCNKEFKAQWNICTNCGGENTIVEKKSVKGLINRKTELSKTATATNNKIPQVFRNVLAGETEKRFKTGIEELDRVFGGGLVYGSTVAIGGDPGVGKSTLILNSAYNISKSVRVLYASAEENTHQVKSRAERIGCADSDNLYVIYEPIVENIIAHVRKIRASVVIIDSINTIYSTEIEASHDTPSQIKHCSSVIREYAKDNDISFIIISQVNKDGEIKGENSFQHNLDSIFYLKSDTDNDYRILLSIKNRFGNAGEVGIFVMTGEGLKSVSNPSQMFLSERLVNVAGSSVANILEGDRPILLEVQALTNLAIYNNSLRQATGFTKDRRINMLASIIDTHIPYASIINHDLYLNVVGGMQIRETSADLSIITAIVSSLTHTPVDYDLVCIAEVGLLGELRSVNKLEMRLNEVARLGFKKAIISKQKGNFKIPSGLDVYQTDILDNAIRAIFGDKISYPVKVIKNDE